MKSNGENVQPREPATRFGLLPGEEYMVRLNERDALATENIRLREELEFVSYLASHDLLEPLRNLLPVCAELAADTMPAHETRARVHAVASEAGRMKTLLENLMEYLRIETFSPALGLVDTTEVLESVMVKLKTKMRPSDTITQDVLPHVLGHRGRLERLFLHLLDNALKFRGTRDLKVHISAMRRQNIWEFCIEDNGIGIEEEYHDIVFRLFQRLYPDETYPGAGAGLALSHKIVESHGGVMAVESKPGRGSRFRFTLPATS